MEAIQRPASLHERAWWLMRQQGIFTLGDLLGTLSDGDEKNAYSKLLNYIRALEHVGVLSRLKRRAPGLSGLGSGHTIWRLVCDLGRVTPVARHHGSVVFDPNSQTTLAAKAFANGKRDTGSSQIAPAHRVKHTKRARQDSLERRKRYPGVGGIVGPEKFAEILPILQSVRRCTKPITVDMYKIFCAVLYVLDSGCQWRQLPSSFPKWRTVYSYFAKWSENNSLGVSVLERALTAAGWRGPNMQETYLY